MFRTFVVIGLTLGVLQAQEQTPDQRLRSAATVLHEILSAPDKGIPEDLLARAQCVMIVPGLKKGAFLVGGEYGRGFAVCRRDGVWGGPAAIRFGGGSFGAQIGGESTDVVMLVMNRHGMEKLASDKFTIGGDGSAAAGPVGRTSAADTDILLHAEILSYSRTRGVFAGVSLDGTVVSQDHSEDRKLYGQDVRNQVVLMGDLRPPAAARPLISELERYSPGKP
jgi:lipid-binding SYLF domain-containing protein